MNIKQKIEEAAIELSNARRVLGEAQAKFDQLFSRIEPQELKNKLTPVKERRKYERKQNLPEPPETSPVAQKSSGDVPATFAGAMKRVMRESQKHLTVNEIFIAIQTGWPALIEERDARNVSMNVAYWASKSHVEKHGMGAMATFEVKNRDFFKEIEQS